MSDGRQIRIFLVDGTPGGLLTAEIMNWTGYIVAAPRSDLARLLGREETSRTGVYVLPGDDPEALGQQLAYIGEGDEVRDRLAQHARSGSRAGRTSGTARSYSRARTPTWPRRTPVTLRASSSAWPLRPGDPGWLTPPRHLRLRCPKLIVRTWSTTSLRRRSSCFTLHLRREGITATAREIDGEFTVLQGSHARRSRVSTPHAYKALHEALVRDRVLVPDPPGGLLRFARDYVFASPSAAAAAVTGRNASGRIEWRIQGSGMNFGEWQLRDIVSSLGT